MDRRSFFNKIGTIAVGSYAYLNLPVTWIPEAKRSKVVSTFMTKAFNDYVKGTGTKWSPMTIYSGQALRDAFEGELQSLQRFVEFEVPKGEKTLLFKTATWKIDPTMNGWEYRFVSAAHPEKENKIG